MKTENKRFWIDTTEIGSIYINDRDKHMSWEDVVNTLNQLYEETNHKYYYSEDDYCFYIKHTDSKISIPIQKMTSNYIISEKAIIGVIDDLNNSNSSFIFDVEEKLKEIG